MESWFYEFDNKGFKRDFRFGNNTKVSTFFEWSQLIEPKIYKSIKYITNGTIDYYDIIDNTKNFYDIKLSQSLETKFIEARLIDDLDLEKGDFRLLKVSNELKMPRNLQITTLVTSNDVLHSWAVPSLGIKIDACPGRLNEIEFLIYKEGTFFGQCSEICGFYHGFMPIVIESKKISDIYDNFSFCDFDKINNYIMTSSSK